MHIYAKQLIVHVDSKKVITSYNLQYVPTMAKIINACVLNNFVSAFFNLNQQNKTIFCDAFYYAFSMYFEFSKYSKHISTYFRLLY